jgi:hypothetical protein
MKRGANIPMSEATDELNSTFKVRFSAFSV